MSLYLRGKIWWCSWQIGGERISESTRTADHQEAQEFHDQRRAELWRERRLDQKPTVTWDTACLAWIDEHACHKRSYTDDLLRLRWITPQLTGWPLDKISADTLAGLRDARAKAGDARSTCNRYLAIVSAVLNYAHGKGWVQGVPKIHYFPEPRGRFRFLSREEAGKLIAELPPHLKQMTKFALATGLRRSNVTGLTWDNVDLARRVAWVWPDEAKAKKAIPVPLTDDAVAVLQQQLGEHPVFVFTFKDSPIFHTKARAWDKACVRAGLDPKEVGFHTLRHTWASWHVMNGTRLEVLQQLGGWSSITMVQRYAHLSSDYLAEYAGNVGSPAYNSATAKKRQPKKRTQVLEKLGWRMGLEPTTTGITIRHRRTGT